MGLESQVRNGLKLKGRWLKCVKENNWGNGINIGDYIQIYQNNDTTPWVSTQKEPQRTISAIDLNRVDKGEFELMPEGFDPNAESDKFIVGQWYKYTNKPDYYYYLKYQHTIKRSDYNQIFGEIIKYKKYASNDYLANTNMENQLVPLTDLSEIQQYLPDNHPDKIIKADCFKKGDYIVHLHPGTTKYYLQNHVYVQREDNISLRTNRSSGGERCESVNVRYNLPETWRYATSEEIVEYDRIGKPYDVTTLKKEIDMKAIQEEAKRRFPIGCQYKCTVSETVGILKLDSITYSIHGNSIYAHNGAGVLYKNGTWAELISLPDSLLEDWKPKKGDWVTIIRPEEDINWNPLMSQHVGKTVQLKTQLNTNPCYFYIPEDSHNWCWEYSGRVKHFRKATESEILLAAGKCVPEKSTDDLVSVKHYEFVVTKKSKPKIQVKIDQEISINVPRKKSITF
jgi:hypothetical protein